MRFLLDTHLLLWAAGQTRRLPIEVRKLLTNPESRPAFSAVSIWEIVIKTGLGREDFG